MAKKRYTYQEQIDALSDAIDQIECLFESADEEYVNSMNPVIQILCYIVEKLRKKRDKQKPPTKEELKFAHELAQKYRRQHIKKTKNV